MCSKKLFLAGLLCLSGHTAHAVCVGNGNANTSQPQDYVCPFWANVGYFKPSLGTVEYLGKNANNEYWCISAGHVGTPSGTVRLNNHDYSVVANSAIDLRNAPYGVDLEVFQIANDANNTLALLPNMYIARNPPITNDEFTLCGNGYSNVFFGTEDGVPSWFLRYQDNSPVRWARGAGRSRRPMVHRVRRR